jgi:hypothetical protein
VECSDRLVPLAASAVASVPLCVGIVLACLCLWLAGLIITGCPFFFTSCPGNIMVIK